MKMVFSVKELSALHIKNSNVNHEAYKSIYLKIVNLIKKQNEIGAVSLEYEIPLFPIDMPFTYNPSHCARYVREKLERGGFDVDMIGNTIRVGWGKTLKKYTTRNVKKCGVTNLARDTKRSSIPVVSSKTNGEILHISTTTKEPLAAKLARLNARIAMS